MWTIGLGLWRQHSGSRRRRLRTQTVAFDQKHIVHAAQGQRPCHGETDHAATDNYNVCRICHFTSVFCLYLVGDDGLWPLVFGL